VILRGKKAHFNLFTFSTSFLSFSFSFMHQHSNSFSSTEVENQKALGTEETEESLRLMIRILVVKLDGEERANEVEFNE
jgi:hypothetical protein